MQWALVKSRLSSSAPLCTMIRMLAEPVHSVPVIPVTVYVYPLF
jgi:hypothetical protein